MGLSEQCANVNPLSHAIYRDLAADLSHRSRKVAPPRASMMLIGIRRS